MDTFTINDLREVMHNQPGPCVSVYLPTHVHGEDGLQDPVRLKNLLDSAEEQLIEDGLRAPEARQVLEAARRLPEDPDFWQGRGHGLALFISDKLTKAYRLPITFEELAVLNRRFQVKPLLPVLAGDHRFLLLTLSQNKVRLFEVSSRSIAEVKAPGLPENMHDALNYVGADRGSQVHSAMRGSLGKQAAVFHGQGGQRDAHKEELAQFCRLVDAALKPALREERTPLLVAGVDRLLSTFREINSYKFTVPMEMSGNCDYLSDHELKTKAWQKMQPSFEQSRRAAIARYLDLSCSGKTTNDIAEVTAAACQGRVETLFVDVQAHAFGVYDEQSGTATVHHRWKEGDDDLLDRAVAETIQHRGVVHAVTRDETPDGNPAAAVLRY